MAASAKALFQATKPKRQAQAGPSLMENLPDQAKPQASRDPLDFDPTPPEATRALLGVEGCRMAEIGGPIWEPAVGDGRMARVLERSGFDVIGCDIKDRGWPGTLVRSFYNYDAAPGGAKIVVTNPPYCEVSARDGHGRWLAHLDALNLRYVAMLLNWDWMAARINGMDGLHARYPVSRAYLCCWKIDFRGGGSPPQRNGWLVWDRDWDGETVLRRLFKEAGHDAQPGLGL